MSRRFTAHMILVLCLLAASMFIAGCADWNNGFEEDILGHTPAQVEAPPSKSRKPRYNDPKVEETSPVQLGSSSKPSSPSKSAPLPEQSLEQSPATTPSPAPLAETNLAEKSINEEPLAPAPLQGTPQQEAYPPPAQASAQTFSEPTQENTNATYASEAPIVSTEPSPAPMPSSPEPAQSQYAATSPPPPMPAGDVTPSSPNGERFRSVYQVSAFVHEDNAKSLRNMLSDRGHVAVVKPSDVNGKTYYRVIVTLEGTPQETAHELTEIGITKPQLVTQTPLP